MVAMPAQQLRVIEIIVVIGYSAPQGISSDIDAQKMYKNSRTNFVTDPEINLPEKHGCVVVTVFKYWYGNLNDQFETHERCLVFQED